MEKYHPKIEKSGLFIISALQIPDSHYQKKNTQNEHIISHFEYFFTCHYSETVWLAENLNEIKITHYEKIFSHINHKSSHFEKGLEIKNFFCLIEISIIFNEVHHIKTKPKNNFQNIYLTYNTFLIHSGNLPLKKIALKELKLTHTKTSQISEPSFFKGFCFKILNITAQI